MEENQTTCARHLKVETGLRCGKCDTPICPKCTVFTPVGARCPDCGSGKSGLFKPSPIQSLCAGAVSLIAGALAGWLVGTFSFGIWAVFLAVPYGTAAGEAVLRSCSRKRGRVMEIIAGVSFAAGAVGGRAFMGLIEAGAHPEIGRNYAGLLFEAFSPFPLGPIALAVALSCVVSRIRYL